MQKGLIQFSDVCLDYKLYRDRSVSIMETILNVFGRKNSHDWFRAVDHASFQILSGESVAIVGANGAGKSTVLRLLAGIYSATSGEVKSCGKVASLIELGVGFHPELTGAENVFLNGALLGFDQKKMTELLPGIAEFSRLEQFMDSPVKYYSSGMFMRLGFALATSVEPDILLIDEVLAVGDVAFQAKCHDRITEFRQSGKTIIFVSHDLEALKKLCERAIWLDSGMVQMDGPVDEVLKAYRDANESKLQSTDVFASSREWGNRDVFFSRVTITDGNGIPARTFTQGETIRINTLIETREGKEVNKVVLGFAVHRPDGRTVVASNNFENGEPLLTITGAGEASIDITLGVIESGNYLLSISLTGNNTDYHWQENFYNIFLRGVEQNIPLTIGSLSITQTTNENIQS